MVIVIVIVVVIVINEHCINLYVAMNEGNLHRNIETEVKLFRSK